MAEYIDRQAAIDALVLLQNHSDMPEDWHKGVSSALSCLYRVPTVQPERKKGKWIEDESPYCHAYANKCSLCGEFNGYNPEKYNWEPNYCPHCGAEMDGE